MKRKTELLAPAKDLKIGIAAINNGADAVYIGAPDFGARKSACNSLEDIAVLVRYAHRFYCRVFVTLNTILYDHELAAAEHLIRQLYEIGADAIIVQDMGILKLDIPPISLHASTQMHNYDTERIKFLDKIGFQRIVLARELSLEQIRAIRKEVKAELEVFVHGALCVSLSGQCYMSQYLYGRSANRGECAQPCRQKWTLKDNAGKILLKDKHILSLKDLNLSEYIDNLIDIGVNSLKIEGRLKDENYVSNIVNHYSSLLNKSSIERIGSGKVISAFQADPERSFSRGYTDYFITGRSQGLVNMDTPKSMGKRIGVVKQTKGTRLIIDTTETIHNGDGLCYLEKGELRGVRVNNVEDHTVICNENVQIAPGTVIFRNYDHQFVVKIEREKSVRKIRIWLSVQAREGQLELKVTDEDGIIVTHLSGKVFEKAEKPGQKERIIQQLEKCGDSDYCCEQTDYTGEEVLFIPAAEINALRRLLLDKLSEEREKQRELIKMGQVDTKEAYLPSTNWQLNVVNQKAAAFYRDHGIETVEAGFEKNKDQSGKELMHTRYCILYELGRCRKQHKNDDVQFPLWLCNEKQQLKLEFDCGECFMKVIAP